MNLPVALCAALESVLDAYLGQDPETAASLERIEGRLVAVRLEGIGVEFLLVPEKNRIRVHGSLGDEPDAVIRATPLAMLRVALSEQPAAALSGGDVRIEGDVEAGERLWGVLRAVEFDWEELMSRYIGDPLAHALGANARDFGAQLKRNLSHVVDDLGEYVTEEARVSPPRAELEGFLDAVDRLREDLDRLEARLSRLEATHRSDEDQA